MPKRLIRMPEVIAKTGLQKSIIYELIAKGRFPKQVRPSPKTIGFLESEIDQWIDQRVSERDERAAAKHENGRLAK